MKTENVNYKGIDLEVTGNFTEGDSVPPYNYDTFESEQIIWLRETSTRRERINVTEPIRVLNEDAIFDIEELILKNLKG